MKKRRLIPVAAAGGVLAFVLSQFFSLNMAVNQVDTSVIDPEAEQSESVQVETETMVSTEDTPSVIQDAKLWLIDVLIDGDSYSVAAVTSASGDPTALQRRPMTVPEIVAKVDQAEGDASGTKVRISRTPEAIAVAEQELTAALDEAGVPADSVERRQRLVE